MVIAQLNKALQEVHTWCLDNQLIPHPGKSEAMLLCTGNPMGSIAPAFTGGSNLGHENTPIRDDGQPQAYLGTACTGHQEELSDQIRLVKTI